jgi:hypothetical protein
MMTMPVVMNMEDASAFYALRLARDIEADRNNGGYSLFKFAAFVGKYYGDVDKVGSGALASEDSVVSVNIERDFVNHEDSLMFRVRMPSYNIAGKTFWQTEIGRALWPELNKTMGVAMPALPKPGDRTQRIAEFSIPVAAIRHDVPVFADLADLFDAGHSAPAERAVRVLGLIADKCRESGVVMSLIETRAHPREEMITFAGVRVAAAARREIDEARERLAGGRTQDLAGDRAQEPVAQEYEEPITHEDEDDDDDRGLRMAG